MRQTLLFAMLSVALWAYALPENCETLLQSRTVIAAVANLLDSKSNKKVVLKLRGEYKSLTPFEIDVLKKVLQNGSSELENASVGNGTSYVEIRLVGPGKSITRELVDLNAEPIINKADSWNVERLEVSRRARIQTLPRSGPISRKEVELRLLIPISSLGFSKRTHDALRDDNVVLVSDLVWKTPQELRRLPNFDQNSIKEVEAKLNELSLLPPRFPLMKARTPESR